jgi:hypothetical protein
MGALSLGARAEAQSRCLYRSIRMPKINMLRKLSLRFDNMVLALVLWLCLLPLVGLLFVPLFGFQTAALVAVALFLVALTICWGICSWKIFES